MKWGKARVLKLFLGLSIAVWFYANPVSNLFGMLSFVMAQGPVATPQHLPGDPQDDALASPSNADLSAIPGATGDWFTTVKQQIRLESLALTPVGNTGIDGFNAFRNFQFNVSTSGLAISRQTLPQANAPKTSTQVNSPAWQLNLALAGIGYRNHIQPISIAGQPTAAATRAEINHVNFTEWYENSENGLEHGFTLPTPPRPTPCRWLPVGAATEHHHRLDAPIKSRRADAGFFSPGR